MVPFRGYRSFIWANGFYQPFDGRTMFALHPLVDTNGPWKPGWNKARCHNDFLDVLRTATGGQLPGHLTPPDMQCQCGFYSYKAPIRAFAEYDSFHEDKTGVVRAVVENAGKVIEHAHGYRAERARVVGIFDRDVQGWKAPVEKIALRYNVPIIGWDEERRKYGQHWPEEEGVVHRTGGGTRGGTITATLASLHAVTRAFGSASIGGPSGAGAGSSLRVYRWARWGFYFNWFFMCFNLAYIGVHIIEQDAWWWYPIRVGLVALHGWLARDNRKRMKKYKPVDMPKWKLRFPQVGG